MDPQLQKQPGARQRSQIDTRERIIASATHLFAENGSNKTTTKDLAQDAGVAVGTIYLHFKDKDAILQAVLETALVRLKQELAKFPTDQTSGYDLVQAKMSGLADFTGRFPDLAAVLFDAGNLASSPGQIALEFLTRSQENGLMTGIVAGHYRGDLHSGLAARALVGILVQILGWWGKNPQAVSRTEVVEVLTELRLNGLKPRD